MKRNDSLTASRKSFIQQFHKKKLELGSSTKEINNELSDWFLFITPRSIERNYK